jgi:hypothetical protein
MIKQLSRSAVFAAAVLCLALQWPAPAAAKDALAVQVCGDSSCDLITDRSILRRFMSGLDASPAPVEAPDPAPYLRLDLAFGAEGQPVEDSWTIYYVPEAHLMATNGEPGEVLWYPVGEAGQGMFREVSSAVVPFGAPERWPREIKPSRSFNPDELAKRGEEAPSSGAEAAAHRTPIRAGVETGGQGFWSNWFVLPLAAVGLVGAAAVARRR